MATPTFRLAQAVLGQDLREFISTRRDKGLTWEQINKELWLATKQTVDVTQSTLRNWMSKNGDEAA